ncbi:hypothetical protein CFREI_11525 [Corynebacterium freiburgense]|nr:hypothetical protein CFREI_11525 [Corynebacterium freiburgense]
MVAASRTPLGETGFDLSLQPGFAGFDLGLAGGLIVRLWFGCLRLMTWSFRVLVGRWLDVLSQIPFFRPILWNLRHDR